MIISPFKKSYEGRQVLDFPEIVLNKGKVYAFIGANGSGKTTAARVISGIEKSDGGARVTDRGSVGYMPQKSFAFRKSLIKNILLNGNDRKRAEELAERLNLSLLSDNKAKNLSGGETSRMALARLMMKKYDLLILDEPTASMDMESTLVTEQMVREYAEENASSVILITHSVQQARRIADYVLYFENGLVEQNGTTDEVIAATTNPKTKRFLEFYGV